MDSKLSQRGALLYSVPCILCTVQEKVMWVLVMDIVHICFKVCSCIYRICSDRTLRKYEYGTILVNNRVNTFKSL